MSSILKNFKNHAECGVVPAKLREGVEEQDLPLNKEKLAPKNCFFKSVHCIDKAVVGLMKDALFGVKQHYPSYNHTLRRYDIYIGARSNSVNGIIKSTVFALTNIVLQPLYLAFACLSYWPAKLVSNKTEGRLTLRKNTESFAGYSNMLSNKAEKHSKKVAGFINTVLNYAFTAVIWTVASLITPFIWAGEKVASKLSKPQSPEPAKDKDTEIGAASTIS